MRAILMMTVVVGLSRPAVAGQIMVHKISLADAVAHAQLAVEIELEKPATAKVDYPVPSDTGKKCAPYSFIAYRGTVKKILHPAKGTAVQVGQRLTIVPASIPQLVMLSKFACDEGGSKSIGRDRFQGASPTDGARLIVLLAWRPGYGWSEAVEGSWLPTKDAKKVLAAVGKGKNARGAGLYAMGSGGPPINEAICLEDDECVWSDTACTGGDFMVMARAQAIRLRAACSPDSKPRAALGTKPVCRAMRCVSK